MAVSRSFFVFLVSLLILGAIARVSNAQAKGLKKNFYKKTCPKAEQIVRDMTKSRVGNNPGLAAKILRMHNHDCFVRGCDGSVLLDTVPNAPGSEKEAIPNLTLQGFDLIDDIKAATEKACPQVVSCADILALATRDAVAFLNKKITWEVLTGRRDGNVSLASEVFGNIPSPFSDLQTNLQIFAKKGLNAKDLVALLGGHTIGVAHCGTFSNRLYNFTGKGDADPSLDPAYAETLRTQCPNPADPAITVELDPQSSVSVDTNFYGVLLQKKGLLQSDAALITDAKLLAFVRQFQVQKKFFDAFADSMKKMGAIEVLTGNAGEIRKQCSKVNP